MYSYPNIVLPVIGGIIIDKIGIKLSTICFALCTLVGQGVFCGGGHFKDFRMMVVGRAIYG